MDSVKLLLYIICIFIGAASILILATGSRKKNRRTVKLLYICIIAMLIVNLYDAEEYYRLCILQTFLVEEWVSTSIYNFLYSGFLYIWILFLQEVTNDGNKYSMILVAKIYLVLYCLFSSFMILVPGSTDHIATWYAQKIFDCIYLVIYAYVAIRYIIRVVKKENHYFAFFISITLLIAVSRYVYFLLTYFMDEEEMGYLFFAALDDIVIVAWLIANISTFYMVYEIVFKTSFTLKSNEDEELSEHSYLKTEMLSEIKNKYNLTTRETEVLSLLADGNTNEEIANTLYISQSTVKGHVRNIFKKMGIRSRWEITKIINSTKGL